MYCDVLRRTATYCGVLRCTATHCVAVLRDDRTQTQARADPPLVHFPRRGCHQAVFAQMLA
eukprot:1603833-Alexandrium_andersonii.AAC.1